MDGRSDYSTLRQAYFGKAIIDVTDKSHPGHLAPREEFPHTEREEYTSLPVVVKENQMRGHFTLEFWQDGKFYVGRLLEVPGVFSQGESLDELRENIQDAYELIVTQERSPLESCIS